MLLCDFGVRDAFCHKQGEVIFPQRQDECDVVLRELIVKGDPIFPCALPLCYHGIVVSRKFLLQAQLHKAAKAGNDLREGCDKAVGQADAHGVEQVAFGFLCVPEAVAGNGAHHAQIDVCRCDSALRRGEHQRGLRRGQHGVMPRQTQKIFCPQVKRVRPCLRGEGVEIPYFQPFRGHVWGNHAHGNRGKGQLRKCGNAAARLRKNEL